jgi:cytochrome c biogenesis protein ResB
LKNKVINQTDIDSNKVVIMIEWIKFEIKIINKLKFFILFNTNYFLIIYNPFFLILSICFYRIFNFLYKAIIWIKWK